jgi:hypothetical protein
MRGNATTTNLRNETMRGTNIQYTVDLVIKYVILLIREEMAAK